MDDEQILTTEKVSLCAACARHPEVRDLVLSDLGEGVCGVCGGTERGVFNPKRFALLRNLIRALIRLHFDEKDYNHHWGGSSIDHILLGEENPILEVAKSTEFNDEFIHRVTWEGEIYPDPDKGICLFAGHDESGLRYHQFSIPKTTNKDLRGVERRLKLENFHAVEAAMEELVDEIEGEVASTVQAGTLWYRGRIGVEDMTVQYEWDSVTRVAKPYTGTDIGALPPTLASAGRTNREGVSVLYLASEIDTAVAEIRPHPSHLVSIGGFRASQDLRVARFDLPIGHFAGSDTRLELYALIYHIDSLLSAQIIPEERHLYSATQLLSDVLIRRGFDGVIYRSSVGKGENFCCFNPHNFEFDESSSTVRRIDSLLYNSSDVPTGIQP